MFHFRILSYQAQSCSCRRLCRCLALEAILIRGFQQSMHLDGWTGLFWTNTENTLFRFYLCKARTQKSGRTLFRFEPKPSIFIFTTKHFPFTVKHRLTDRLCASKFFYELPENESCFGFLSGENITDNSVNHLTRILNKCSDKSMEVYFLTL